MAYRHWFSRLITFSIAYVFTPIALAFDALLKVSWTDHRMVVALDAIDPTDDTPAFSRARAFLSRALKHDLFRAGRFCGDARCMA